MTDPIIITADFSGQIDATAAFVAAAAKTVSQLRAVQDAGGFVVAESCPRVIIPHGIYAISDEIWWGPAVRIEGNGAMIRQTNKTKSSFVFNGGADIGLKGIKFIGGAIAVSINNPNVDGSQFWLSDCRFDRTSGPAVLAASSASSGILSAQLTIEKCRWRDCWAALDTAADQTTIRDSWIAWTDANEIGNACVSNRRGYLRLTDSQLIPVMSSSAHRWIDSWGSLYSERVKFGGEGAGIPIVRHFTAPPNEYPWQGDSIVLRDSQLSAGQSSDPESAIITLDGGLPSLILIDGCNWLVDVPWIRDAGSLAKTIAATNRPIQVRFGANVAWPVSPNYPPAMRRTVKSQISQ